MNINEAIIKIKSAGASKVRAVPMPGADVRSGQYKIEVLGESNIWDAVLEGIPSKRSADDIIAQATSRLLLG